MSQFCILFKVNQKRWKSTVKENTMTQKWWNSSTWVPGPRNLQLSIFTLFLIMYIMAVLGNASIIILVASNHRLQTPMYFFLCSLSFLEIWYTTAIVPKSLPIFLGNDRSISFSGCLVQMYFVFTFGSTENYLLTVMAYDRYLAICYPLRYHTVMNIKLSSS